MTKRIFVAAFVFDEMIDGGESRNAHNIATQLATFMDESGMSHFIVWDNAEAFVADHAERGPINLDYLLGAFR